MYIKDYNKTALIYRGQNISYAQTIEAVKKFAAGYQLKKGERAAIFAENRPEWVYSLFSVWEKSGIAVPIDYLSPADEVGYILNDCRPEIVFCSAKTKDVLIAAADGLKDGYRPKIAVFEELPGNDSAPSLEPVSYDVHDTAIIIYTSGTTGSPKGVMLTHDNLHSNIEAVVDGARIYSGRDRLLAILPFHHIFPLMGNIMAPLSCGGTLVILEKISSEDILNAFREHKITIVIGVPRLYRLFHKGLMDKINASPAAKILLKISRSLKSLSFGRLVFKKAQEAFGGSITYFVSGGAKLDERVGRDLYALGFEILEGFGMTEAAPMITFTRPGQVKIGSPGTPTSQTEVRIEDGEVLARGRNIMKGYYHKPEDTAAILKDGWLHTGDQGYLDQKNRLFITGRKKEIIVLSNGKNINPEEIENRILSISPLIKEIGVYPRDEKLGAVIHPDLQTVKQEQVVNLRETIKWLVLDKFNLTVPSYKKIHHFTLVGSELPKTRLGKLKRFLLPQMDTKTAETHQAKPDPDTVEYRVLKNYLEKALDQQVWPQQHLEYDLGLDSLGKIELDLFLEKSFGMKLDDEDSVAHHTVEELSRLIAGQKSSVNAENSDWHSTLQEQVKFEPPQSMFMQQFLKVTAAPLFRLYFRLKGTGQDRLPPAPFILAPNHQSFLDGLFLSILLPDKVLKNTYFLAAGKHIKTPLTRFYARHSNMLVMDINRDLKKTLQQAAAAIREGRNLAIFPEGARSRDGNLLEFKKTFAILSRELQVPVVPVAVSGAYAAFPIGRKFPKAGKITLKFLEPIHPGEMDYQQIADKTREAIAGNL